MAILKNKTQGNYTIVSNGILKNQSLSLKDRGLIITLLSLPDRLTGFRKENFLPLVDCGNFKLYTSPGSASKIYSVPRTNVPLSNPHAPDGIDNVLLSFGSRFQRVVYRLPS